MKIRLQVIKMCKYLSFLREVGYSLQVIEEGVVIWFREVIVGFLEEEIFEEYFDILSFIV